MEKKTWAKVGEKIFYLRVNTPMALSGVQEIPKPYEQALLIESFLI